MNVGVGTEPAKLDPAGFGPCAEESPGLLVADGRPAGMKTPDHSTRDVSGSRGTSWTVRVER
ncbi:hypothetical protein AB0J81_23745 [Streptomyces bobili]|uniref:hypothetical protein n=1 Tax=Streptomyces bobili TaxID=67280 RepID=UPI0033C58B1C